MTDPIKSMAVFFIDNRHQWPENAHLHGNLVLWPDEGKYPTFVPVALADHPQFDGKVVVQAGNRGIVVSLVAGAVSTADVQRGMSAKGLEQYRIGVDAIIHAIMLLRAETEGGGEGDVSVITLLNMLAKVSPKEAEVLILALRAFMKKPDGTMDVARAVGLAEEMSDALSKGLTK